MTAETAGRRAQAGALGCKLATLQSRSLGTNACLVAAPVMFCLLLLVLQFAINHALSSSEFTVRLLCCWLLTAGWGPPPTSATWSAC